MTIVYKNTNGPVGQSIGDKSVCITKSSIFGTKFKTIQKYYFIFPLILW